MSVPENEPATPHLHRGFQYIAPALFITTALVQLAMAKFGPLTPWKCGGFGLFSTPDKAENRVFVARLVTASGEVPLDISPFGYDFRNALAFPVQANLRRVAESIASEQVTGNAVRAEVWKWTFDPSTGELRPVLVASCRVPVAR